MPRCWCGEPATHSFLERVGTVPVGGHNDRGPRDLSGLFPRPVCSAHRPTLGGGGMVPVVNVGPRTTGRAA